MVKTPQTIGSDDAEWQRFGSQFDGLIDSVRHFKNGPRKSQFTAFDQDCSEIVGKVRTCQSHAKWETELKNAKKRAKSKGGMKVVFGNVATALDRTFDVEGKPVRNLLDKMLEKR